MTLRAAFSRAALGYRSLSTSQGATRGAAASRRTSSAARAAGQTVASQEALIQLREREARPRGVSAGTALTGASDVPTAARWG